MIYTQDGRWCIAELTDAAPIHIVPLHTCMSCGVGVRVDFVELHEAFHDRNP